MIAILSLALGIGANAVIFSFAYFILLRPLPVANASGVIVVQSQFRGESLVGLAKACCKTVSSSYQGTTSVVPDGGAASTRALAPAPPAAKAATPFAVVSARLKPCPDTNHFLTSLR